VYIITRSYRGWACCAIQSKLLGMKLIVVLWFRAGNRRVHVCARVCCGGEGRVRALARLRDKLCALSKHNWKLSSRWSPDRVIRLSHKNRPPHLCRALKDRTPPRPADGPVPPASSTIQHPAAALSVVAAARTVYAYTRRRSHVYYIVYRVCLATSSTSLQLIILWPENNAFALNILFSIRTMLWYNTKKIY